MLATMYSSTYAAEVIDYTAKLAELQGLLNQCVAAGISTDYEMVNYKTIERFQGYINEDLTRVGTDYNISCMEELYKEAKTNLEAYLAGTKKSFPVTRADMDNLSVRQSAIYDGNGPVFSIGYGHFYEAQADIPNFQGFGTSNIGMEIGPSQIMTKNSEGKYVVNTSSGTITQLKKVLANAENNNIGVTLLLSPHYMVDGLSSDVYKSDSKVFFGKYNINHPEVKEVLTNYINGLLPLIKDYKSLKSICISNEPMLYTYEYYDFYNDYFQAYLEDIHGTVENLNKAYGKTYTAFSEVNMPTERWSKLHSYTAIDYDWMEFNDKVHADWQNWFKGLVKNYLPDVPVHNKMMGYFEDYSSTILNDRSMLERGTDLELMGAGMDIAGNDTWDFMDDVNRYYRSMFLYDYQFSVLDKPVYNSEDHIIADRSENYNINQRKHLVNNLWMGAAHGRSLSTIWVWARPTSSTTDFDTAMLTRPDCVAATGKTNLNLARLNDEMHEIQQEAPKVAIFYSKPSRLYQADTTKNIIDVYAAVVNSGQKVGIVSDKSFSKLSEYDALIIPGAVNGTDEAYGAILNFIDNGGRVLYSDNAFSTDEYKNKRDNSALVSSATSFSQSDDLNDVINSFVDSCGIAEVTLRDSTGAIPENLDWSYSVDNNGILINMTNLEYDNTKDLSVYYNGEKLDNMTELISGTSGVSTVSLEGYTPQLLSYEFKVDADVEITNISNDKANSTITWDYSTDNNIGANIYSVEKDGYTYFKGTVQGNSYTYSENGTYIVRAVRDMGESNGRIITITDNDTDMSVTLERFSYGTGSVFCDISVTNNKAAFVTGVIAVKVLKADGSVDNYIYNKMTLGPEKTSRFTTSMEISSEAAELEILSLDSILSKNVISNVVKQELNAIVE